MDKKQEKLIDSLIEQKKTLWAAMIVLTGGLAGLLLSLTFPLITLINLPKLFLLNEVFMNYLDGLILLILLSIFGFITIRGFLKLRSLSW